MTRINSASTSETKTLLNLNSALQIKESYSNAAVDNTTNYIIHRAFQNQLKNQRQGTASVKTRAEVRGGGRKPWKQKGTGQARAGSIRSPLWNGGGVSFGPKPRKYNCKLNRKELRLALKLTLFKKQNQIQLVEDFILTTRKTQDFLILIKNLNLEIDLSNKIGIIIPSFYDITNIRTATKNLKNITLIPAHKLNIKDLILSKQLVIMLSSLKTIQKRYNN